MKRVQPLLLTVIGWSSTPSLHRMELASHCRSWALMLGGMTTHDDSLPLFALDLETTGLSPRFDHVVEVGLAGLRPFDAVVSDARPSSPGAQAIHRITPEELQRSGIPGAAAFEGLLEALGNGPVHISAHNASFEQGFLEAWAYRLGLRLPEIDWVCTLDLARSLCPEPSVSKGLEALAWRLGLQHGALHRAPEDAALTVRLHAILQAWEKVKATLGQEPFLVYLAGPVRGNGSQACMRFNRNQMMLLAQWAQGVLPKATLFVPHGNFAFLDESRDPNGQVRELAMRSCEQVLSRCDALVLCASELSPGMLQERNVAQQLGIPVFQVPGWDAFQTASAPQVEGAA